MGNAKLLFGCNGANKKGLNYVAKSVSSWCGDRTMNVLLDSDAATGDNISTSQAIDIAL